MDINEAALRLKVIETAQAQIAHLNEEARSSGATYADQCNERANELLIALLDKTQAQNTECH